MSEETTPVGNSDSASGDSQSSGGGSQQSVDLSAVLAEVQSLKKQLSGLQKGNDKVNARVEQRVNEVLGNPQIARILELAKAGTSSEEIEERLILDVILQERKGKARSGSGGAGSAGGAVDAGLSALVEEFGLDANDSEVAEALSKSDSVKLARLAVQKSKVPTPDASTQPPISGKEKGDDPTDETALRAAYEKEAQQLRESRMMSPLTLSKLKSKYRRKGLSIY